MLLTVIADRSVHTCVIPRGTLNILMRNATVTFCFPSYTQSRGLHEIGYSRPLYADPLHGLSPLPPYYPSPGVTVFAARARGQ